MTLTIAGNFAAKIAREIALKTTIRSVEWSWPLVLLSFFSILSWLVYLNGLSKCWLSLLE